MCIQWAFPWTYIHILVMQSILHIIYVCLCYDHQQWRLNWRQSFPHFFLWQLIIILVHYHSIALWLWQKHQGCQQCFTNKITFLLKLHPPGDNAVTICFTVKIKQNMGHKRRLHCKDIGHLQLGTVRPFINASIRRQNRQSVNPL